MHTRSSPHTPAAPQPYINSDFPLDAQQLLNIWDMFGFKPTPEADRSSLHREKAREILNHHARTFINGDRVLQNDDYGQVFAEIFAQTRNENSPYPTLISRETGWELVDHIAQSDQFTLPTHRKIMESVAQHGALFLNRQEIGRMADLVQKITHSGYTTAYAIMREGSKVVLRTHVTEIPNRLFSRPNSRSRLDDKSINDLTLAFVIGAMSWKDLKSCLKICNPVKYKNEKMVVAFILGLGAFLLGSNQASVHNMPQSLEKAYAPLTQRPLIVRDVTSVQYKHYDAQSGQWVRDKQNAKLPQRTGSEIYSVLQSTPVNGPETPVSAKEYDALTDFTYYMAFTDSKQQASMAATFKYAAAYGAVPCAAIAATVVFPAFPRRRKDLSALRASIAAVQSQMVQTK